MDEHIPAKVARHAVGLVDGASLVDRLAHCRVTAERQCAYDMLGREDSESWAHSSRGYLRHAARYGGEIRRRLSAGIEVETIQAALDYYGIRLPN